MSHLVEDDNNIAVLEFIHYMCTAREPDVLEMGAKRSRAEISTLHKWWIPHAKSFTGTDFEYGFDVDVLADAHSMSKTWKEPTFDAIISCAVFEHLEKPWIVAEEMAKILKPRGAVLVQTHQSFPLHSYPNDYWRFSADAMRVLFHRGIGFEVRESAYQFPCRIESERDPGGRNHPAYLNINCFAVKL